MRYSVSIRSKDAGFTMVEVMIAMMILTVAITGLLATIIPATQLIMVNRETTIAMGAAMGMIEYMSDPELFPDLFILYNRKTGDDPAWWNPAPGQSFPVDGLDPIDGEVMVGKIYFPTFCATPGNVETEELREKEIDPEYVGFRMDVLLGLPRDLNGNGTVNDLGDRAGDYYVLPVIIRLEWTGIAGERQLMMTTLISER